MSSAEIRGRFVWHELITSDSAGASAFYPRVASWTSRPWEKDSKYTLWVGNSGPLGGLVNLSETAASRSAHWLPYIGTPDIEGTVAAAKNLGGRVLREIQQIPGAGRYAVLADPAGATFAVYAAGEAEGGAGGPPQVGDFSWHELATTDVDAALRFYSQLFGWGRGPGHDMGEMGVYQLFTHGGKQIGGMYRMRPDMPASSWLCYLRVSDVDNAANAARAAGGRVVNGPMEVPGGDWIAVMADPQGAAFAVHEIRPLASMTTPPKAQPAAKPAAARKPAAEAAPGKGAEAGRAAAVSSKVAAAAKRPASKRRAGKRAKAKSSAAAGRARAARRAAAKRATAKRAAPKRRPAKKSSQAARGRTGARKSAAKTRSSRRLRAARKHR